MSKTERRNLQLLFLLFGLGIMAIAPRNPEIKANLNIPNGTFGTLLSLGGLGSLISLMFGGYVVHRLGPKNVLAVSSTVMYSAVAAMPHLHNAWYFLVVNIVAGAAISMYHISINAQALHRQDQTGLVLIPRLHGLWSTGALGTAILAFFITSQVSLAWHIDVMMIVIWLATQRTIWNLRDNFLIGNRVKDPTLTISPTAILAAFKFEPIITFGLVCALMIEFASNDWATIFAKEQIGMSEAVSILAYIAFMVSMISGRFTIHRLLLIKPEKFWMRWGPLFGGVGFVVLITFGTWLSHSNKEVGYVVTLLAFIFAGLGCSHFGPTFFGIAGRRSSLPGSVVVAQLGLVNTVLIFIVKIGIAWIAQATSVMWALVVPGVMLIFVTLVANLGRSEIQKA
ncbi:MAG: MFS transporter [Actinomycetes bacterium]